MYAITKEIENGKMRENVVNDIKLVSIIADGTLMITSNNMKDLYISKGSAEVFNSYTDKSIKKYETK